MSTDINSIIGRLGQQINKLIARLYSVQQLQELPPTGLITDIGKQINDVGEKLGLMISTPITPEGAKARLTELDVLVTKLFLGLYGAQGAIESLPTVNKTGFANFTLSYVEARGVLSIIRHTIEPFIRHNLSPALDYALNQQYRNILPSYGELERLRDIGKLDPEGFTTQGERVTGIRGDMLELIRESKHQVPGLEDFNTWNIRHQDETIDLTKVQDLMGINWNDYGKYFDERQFNDISIRFVQSAANLLNFNEAQITELLRLNRLDPRNNDVLGMSPRDVAVKVVMNRKKLYDAGLEGTATRSKHFGYSLLIQMADAGIDNSDIEDEDLKSEGWDDIHRDRLTKYIDAKVAERQTKAAAKAAKTSGA